MMAWQGTDLTLSAEDDTGMGEDVLREKAVHTHR